jgi:type I restriction enzyme M protein
MRKLLIQWWADHSPRIIDLPKRRDLNQVRANFLDTFVTALCGGGGKELPSLDRFKLAGVIATWWTDTLPDFKTLLENGFRGVVDGWVDAIADAVEDEEATGPSLDPFSHKLVRRTMTDYLERIALSKDDIGRLKGEKEAFEQSNAPEELDEEELAGWNYAKNLERQMRELKAEQKGSLKELAKLERAAVKTRATLDDKHAAAAAKGRLQQLLDQLATLEALLVPYEHIKERLSEARARYRVLSDDFVSELKSRCGAMNQDQRHDLVLELFAQDVMAGLESALAEKQQGLIRVIQDLWDRYRVTLTVLRNQRTVFESQLSDYTTKLGYA